MSKKIKRWIIIFCILAIGLLFCYYENQHLVVTEYSISNKKISDELAGYKILQISDFHNVRFGFDNDSFIKKIDEIAPDRVVVTGDLVDSNHTNVKVSLDMIERVASKYPVYYVTGNHEYWLSEEDRTQLFSGMENCGVVILHNESVQIEVGESSFSLIGLDDKSLLNFQLSSIINEEMLNVVLAHEPQYFNNYSSEGADIVFTGHAHGGQFILPFIGAVYAPDQGFLPEYTSGTFASGDTTMIVSRGLGNSVIPVRLFNDPELVVVTLD